MPSLFIVFQYYYNINFNLHHTRHSIKKSVLTDKLTGVQYLLIQEEFLLPGHKFSYVRK